MKTQSIECGNGEPAGLNTNDSIEQNQQASDDSTELIDSELLVDIQTNIDNNQDMPLQTASNCDVQVDWTDVSPAHKKLPAQPSRGALKLTGDKTRSSPPPESIARVEENQEGKTAWEPTEKTDLQWNTDWAVEDDIKSKKSPNHAITDSGSLWKDKKSKQGERQTQHVTFKTKKQANSKKLGEEFDIMALDMKNIGSVEVDYFADMMPDIEHKADSLMSAMTMSDSLKG